MSIPEAAWRRMGFEEQAELPPECFSAWRAAHLCDIEKGRRLVTPEKAAESAAAMGYSVNQFVAQAIEDSLRRMGLKLKVEIKAA